MMEGGHLLTADIEPMTGRDDVAILKLIGEADLATADQVREAFRRLVELDVTTAVIDASGVEFIDSTGLHALVDGERMLQEQGMSAVLVPSRIVKRVLDLVFPDGLFTTRVDTLEEALALIRG